MHRVLVIDDNPDDLALAEVALSRAGFDVLLLDEPLLAVEIAALQRVAGILLDRRMPDATGIEVLRALRGDPRTRSIPVLFLSADGDVESRIEGLEEGANDYLSKPFHPAELVLRVERLVSNGTSPSDSLEGKLEHIPLGDVLQTLAIGRRSGFLIVVSGEIGRLAIVAGEIVSAHRGILSGREALIDLIAASHGRFRFVSRARERPSEQASIDLQGALLEAAWLEDELGRFGKVPVPTEGLLWLHHAPKVVESSRPLPIDEVTASLRRSPGATLAELIADVALAPKRVALAVALLIADGSVAVAAASIPSRSAIQVAGETV